MSSYKFRILIDTDTSEEIFRDIIISSSENFEVFYQIILNCFDFSGDQLASFYLSNDDWDKGREIALLDMGLGDETDELLLMEKTSLESVISKQGQKLILVYDFLKMWCFLLELVEILPQHTAVPKVDLSVGIAPLENSKEIATDIMEFQGLDLGNDIDDIFSDFESGDGDFEDFENIDDFDL